MTKLLRINKLMGGIATNCYVNCNNCSKGFHSNPTIDIGMLSEQKRFELLLTGYKPVTSETAIYTFKSKSVLNVNQNHIYPCENVKLIIEGNGVNGIKNLGGTKNVEVKDSSSKNLSSRSMERFYSLINNPTSIINSYENLEFKMLIQENTGSEKHLSFPFTLREKFLNKSPKEEKIYIEYPYGALKYLGGGCFLVKGTKITPKRIMLLTCGTGVAPIFQLAQAMMNEGEDEGTNNNQITEGVELINITKTQEGYFHSEFTKIFSNYYNKTKTITDKVDTNIETNEQTSETNKTAKTSKPTNLNSLKPLKGNKFTNYFLINDDYNGNLIKSKELISYYISQTKHKYFYILCGSDNMINKVSDILKKEMGINQDDIALFY